MPALSLRLSDELDHRLEEEAQHEGLPRSEVARQAISEFLARRERERFMAEMVAEARTAYADKAIRSEAIVISEEFLETDNEALDKAEGRDPGEPGSGKSDEKWWK